MSKPTSAVKRRYNKAAYRRYEFSVKIDTKLNYLLEQYKNEPDNSLSELIKELLCQYFKVHIDELYIPYHLQKNENGKWIKIPNINL